MRHLSRFGDDMIDFPSHEGEAALRAECRAFLQASALRVGAAPTAAAAAAAAAAATAAPPPSQ